MGDDLLELAKAKELASVLGGAWHSEEWDADSDSEQSCRTKPQAEPSDHLPDKNNNNNNATTMGTGSFLRRTLSGFQRKGSNSNGGSNSSVHSSSGSANGDSVNGSGSMGARRPSGGRRPADGRAPGRRDPKAVARMEAEAAARKKAEEEEPEGVDRSWQLPTNVDYYTAPAALLRELVKEMPPDKRLSFQTRVANARSKESIEGLLEDYAERLESLALPHARSREIDLQQVKKDTARERVVLDGEEIAFWGSASDKPHTWHEELWAMLEARVTEKLLSDDPTSLTTTEVAPCNGHNDGSLRGGAKTEGVRGGGSSSSSSSNARVLAREEWNKARAVATTSEIFKAMSRTGAGGDAYFALVALFCTADKLVVPVHCQESPITVEFVSSSREPGGGVGGALLSHWPGKGRAAAAAANKKGAEGDNVHVLVTVPSTFDIYLRDGAAGAGESGSGSGSGSGSSSSNGLSSSRSNSFGNGSGHKRRNGGLAGEASKMHRKGSGGSTSTSSSTQSKAGNNGAAGADASMALHLVRVKAVVVEEIWVAGSSKAPPTSCRGRGGRKSSASATAAAAAAADDTPPTLRFLLDAARAERRASASTTDGVKRLSNERPTSAGGGGAEVSVGLPPTTPVLALTRTKRRMCVTVVPEPSAVSEMVRNFSRKIGVDVAGPQPPRVLGR